MQSEPKSRVSFFDDDDVSIQFAFKKPEKIHQKDLETPPTLKDNLSKQVSESNSPPQQGTYALHNRTLAYYKVLIPL